LDFSRLPALYPGLADRAGLLGWDVLGGDMADKLNNKAFFSAYKRGRRAFDLYGDSAVCPYPETRGGQYGQVVTFSRAFQKYWREGIEDARDNLPIRYFV